MAVIATWVLLVLTWTVVQGQTKNEENNATLPVQNNLRLPDWVKSATTWESPADLSKDLPSYLSGYSYDGRPVHVLEFGKWDTIKYVDSTEVNSRNYYKRIDKLVSVVVTETSPLPEAEEGSIVIFDVDGLSLRQLVSPSAVKAHLEFMRRVESVEEYISEFFFINVSYAAQSWLEIVRPVAGRLIGKAGVIGTSKAKVAVIFARFLPSSRYAPKYGGKASFVPLKRY